MGHKFRPTSTIILSKRDLRSNIKELNGLKKLDCGEVSCYIKTIQMSKESTKIQLCSTFMDMSDDNNDLNDFLGNAMKKTLSTVALYPFCQFYIAARNFSRGRLCDCDSFSIQ